jgi:hypothetical protein
VGFTYILALAPARLGAQGDCSVQIGANMYPSLVSARPSSCVENILDLGMPILTYYQDSTHATDSTSAMGLPHQINKKKSPDAIDSFRTIFYEKPMYGAENRTRTGTELPPADFKSAASA